MGTSLDKIYPSENIRLARHILENDGCWVSEYAIGASTDRNAFVVTKIHLRSIILGGYQR